MKACSKCKVEKELCFFYKSSRNKSGYRAECIECEKKYKEEIIWFAKQNNVEVYQMNLSPDSYDLITKRMI